MKVTFIAIVIGARGTVTKGLCLLVFASLIILDGFHLLLFIQLTADLAPELSGGSMFHHIYAKPFFVTLKQLQKTL